MDPKRGELIIAEITDEYVHDTTYLEDALKATGKKRGKVLINEIAHSGKCYRLSREYNKTLYTSPKEEAVLTKEDGYEQRNEAIKRIQGFGNDRMARSIWAKMVGYHRRVVAENMMARWKKLYGGELRSRCAESCKKEVKLKGMIINEMIN